MGRTTGETTDNRWFQGPTKTASVDKHLKSTGTLGSEQSVLASRTEETEGRSNLPT